MRPILELDRHGPPAPQVIGAIMAAAPLPPSGRRIAFRFVDAALARPGVLPEGLEVRRLYEGLPGVRPSAAGHRDDGRAERVDGATSGRACRRSGAGRWRCSGSTPGIAIERDDVQQRFRRLVRLAHPDHGAGSAGAAERIAELAEAREAAARPSIASAGTERPARVVSRRMAREPPSTSPSPAPRARSATRSSTASRAVSCSAPTSRSCCGCSRSSPRWPRSRAW